MAVTVPATAAPAPAAGGNPDSRHGGGYGRRWPHRHYYGFRGFWGGPFGYRSRFYDPFYDRNSSDESSWRGDDNVRVSVSPAKETEVWVNGMLYSRKGKATFNLPTGLWKVELRARGYATQFVDLDVQEGVRYSVERKLARGS